MNDKILTPNFTLGEPNMNSARKKNDEGICSIHLCNNKLGNPPATGWLGLFICDECRKPIDKMLQEEDVMANERIVKTLIQMIENQKIGK